MNNEWRKYAIVYYYKKIPGASIFYIRYKDERMIPLLRALERIVNTIDTVEAASQYIQLFEANIDNVLSTLNNIRPLKFAE